MGTLKSMMIYCGITALAWWSFFHMPALLMAYVYFLYVVFLLGLIVVLFLGKKELKEVFQSKPKSQWWVWLFRCINIGASIVLFAIAGYPSLICLYFVILLLGYLRAKSLIDGDDELDGH